MKWTPRHDQFTHEEELEDSRAGATNNPDCLDNGKIESRWYYHSVTSLYARMDWSRKPLESSRCGFADQTDLAIFDVGKYYHKALDLLGKN